MTAIEEKAGCGDNSRKKDKKVTTLPRKRDKSRDFPVFSTPTMFPRRTMGKGGSNKGNSRTMVSVHTNLVLNSKKSHATDACSTMGGGLDWIME